jgi:hypothetical protein
MEKMVRASAAAAAKGPRGIDRLNGDRPEDKASRPAKQVRRRRSARIVSGERGELAIYNGRDVCGFIRPSGDGFLALYVDRRTIGVFPTLHEALQALGGSA